MDCSPPGSSVHGIFQARILESVAVSYSRGSSQPRDQGSSQPVSRLLHWQLDSSSLHQLGSPGESRELTEAKQWWHSLAPALSCRFAAWRISADLFFYHIDLEHDAEMIFFPLHHCLLQSITLVLMHVLIFKINLFLAVPGLCR